MLDATMFGMMQSDADVTERVRSFFAAAREKGLPREALLKEFCRGVGCHEATAYRWIGGYFRVMRAFEPRVKTTLARLERKYQISR